MLENLKESPDQVVGWFGRGRRFLGEVDLVHLAVQGLDRPIQARLRTATPATPGHDVGVDVDPHEVLVFAAPHP